MSTQLLMFQRMLARFRKIVIDRIGASHQIYFHHRVEEYRHVWKEVAEHIGATFEELDKDLWQIQFNGVKTRILNYQLEFDNPVILGIAGRKPLIHRLLAQEGLSVPDYVDFPWTDIDKAHEFLTHHPRGCVIKPAAGYGGQGVTTHLQHKREIKKAAILASLYCPNLIMEPMIPGESYRLLVLRGKMIHAVRRAGPRLKGDGKSTVQQLLNNENQKLKTEKKPRISIDRDLLFTLQYQDLSLTSTPTRGKIFILKSVNDPIHNSTEVRTVYNEQVTDTLHESVILAAEKAAHILQSEFVGVDIITTDATLPLEESGGIINEVNTTPALHHHYDSSTEKFPESAVKALEVLTQRQCITENQN